MTVRPVVMLRQATADDAPKIAEIWQQGWRDGHLGSVPQELVAAAPGLLLHQDSFCIRAARRTSDTTVAVVDGQVAGFVMVVGDEAERAHPLPQPPLTPPQVHRAMLRLGRHSNGNPRS